MSMLHGICVVCETAYQKTGSVTENTDWKFQEEWLLNN